MSYKHTGIQNVLSSLDLLKAISPSALDDGQLIAVKNVVWSENSVQRKFTTVYMWDPQVTAKGLLMDLNGETAVDFPTIAKAWYWNRNVSEYVTFDEGSHMEDYAHLIVIPNDVGRDGQTDGIDYDQPGRWVATDYATFLLHAGFTQWDARSDGSLIPKTNAAFDLGDAENKVRHLFLSDNSIWIGEKHRISISDGGELRFQKRKNGKLPQAFLDSVSPEDITDMKDEAKIAGGVDSFNEVDLSLSQWEEIGRGRLEYANIADTFLDPDFDTVSSLSGDESQSQSQGEVAWSSITGKPTELEDTSSLLVAADIFEGGNKSGMINTGKYVNTEYTLPSDVLVSGDIFDAGGMIDSTKYLNTQLTEIPSEWDVLRSDSTIPSGWADGLTVDVDLSGYALKSDIFEEEDGSLTTIFKDAALPSGIPRDADAINDIINSNTTVTSKLSSVNWNDIGSRPTIPAAVTDLTDAADYITSSNASIKLSGLYSDVAENTGKVGITTNQANAIATNSEKTTYPGDTGIATMLNDRIADGDFDTTITTAVGTAANAVDYATKAQTAMNALDWAGRADTAAAAADYSSRAQAAIDALDLPGLAETAAGAVNYEAKANEALDGWFEEKAELAVTEKAEALTLTQTQDGNGFQFNLPTNLG